MKAKGLRGWYSPFDPFVLPNRRLLSVHCETRVISVLFGLLFWDIIFKSIPGAFETPYQTAPLDIADDSFYHARKDLMEERLAAIEAGQGADLIQVADASHRASATWCVGVQWDLFSSEDLVDIVTVISL